MIAEKACNRLARKEKRARRGCARGPGRLRHVDHPRFDDHTTRSGEHRTEAEIRRACWSRGPDTSFPETVMIADITRQIFGACPCGVHVDIARQCRRCRRRLPWFALQQKHWFEDLGFFVDAQCDHCRGCRYMSQMLRARLLGARREANDAPIAKSDKTTAERERVGRLGDTLAAEGEITRTATLRSRACPNA